MTFPNYDDLFGPSDDSRDGSKGPFADILREGRTPRRLLGKLTISGRDFDDPSDERSGKEASSGPASAPPSPTRSATGGSSLTLAEAARGGLKEKPLGGSEPSEGSRERRPRRPFESFDDPGEEERAAPAERINGSSAEATA